MAKLLIKNLTKIFDSKKVLDNVNLNVCDGEFVVLLGPSGSGKSTILRIIAGLENPTNGDVYINDNIVNNVSSKERDVAMVFQNYALYPHMSVFENLAFPLKMKNNNNFDIKKSVDEVADLLEIKQYLSKKPKELSGGERQRVALGRAIIRNPKLFLMDEPLSNLDAKLRTYMRSELLKLHKKIAATVIYVTHDQIEALTMGDKIAVINHGKVQQIGTPNDIYKTPINTFVGGFVGVPQMNFFDFKIVNNKVAMFCNHKIDLNVNISDMFKSLELIDKNIILGVRPENVLLNSISDVSVKAKIDLIEILGDEYIVYANCSDEKNNAVQQNISLKCSGVCSLKRNETINVSFSLSNCHFFDPVSKLRIGL